LAMEINIWVMNRYSRNLFFIVVQGHIVTFTKYSRNINPVLLSHHESQGHLTLLCKRKKFPSFLSYYFWFQLLETNTHSKPKWQKELDPWKKGYWNVRLMSQKRPWEHPAFIFAPVTTVHRALEPWETLIFEMQMSGTFHVNYPKLKDALLWHSYDLSFIQWAVSLALSSIFLHLTM
jgi:hypothetical protein